MTEEVVRPTRTYDAIMEAQWEQRADRAREALIEDPDRPSLLGEFMDLAEQRRDADINETIVSDLPTDGDKIRLSMLDSKADLQDLIDGCERFRL